MSNSDRMKGLEKARKVRQKRSEIKNQLKKGETDLCMLFKDGEFFDDFISGMKVLSIISALPGNGRVSAMKVLEELNISPHKKIGGLGKKQKENFYKKFKIT
ncbi:MAG: hypothetical protein JW770_03590 [Actinobacteria bacterium]|nr:hypothetical protein [Actinomycetota bacterium]